MTRKHLRGHLLSLGKCIWGSKEIRFWQRRTVHQREIHQHVWKIQCISQNHSWRSTMAKWTGWATVAEMMDKVLEEANCDYDIAITWCVNAKNLLQNVHGFSPYQLAIGQNPTLASFLHNKPSAFMNTPTSKVLWNNLNALHATHKAFTESERSGHLRRALHSNTLTYSDIVYLKLTPTTFWLKCINLPKCTRFCSTCK